ncbi:MAG TPA: hypothetical protein VG713_18820, partial [Pirellulales bacterium]|nr:hypothetical protein [Pirellulales bacterium]
SLLEDGAERTQRWAKNAADILTIFLTDPVIGLQTLSVRGSVAIVAETPVELPMIVLDGVSAEGTRVALVRQHAVTVDVRRTVGLDSSSSLPVDAHPERGRTVGVWTVRHESPLIELATKPNMPVVHSEELLTVTRDEQGWRAIAELHWQVESGLLDAVRLDLPSSWRGPFQISPPATTEVVELPGGNRSQLVIYPRTAVGNSLQTTISAAITPSAGDVISVPDLVPVQVENRRRFVRLPIQIGLQEAVWETLNLKRAELPESFHPPANSAVYETYEALAGRITARLKTIQKVVASPILHLADIKVHFSSTHEYYGTATFDLELGEAPSCTLVMPRDSRVLQAVVNDQPAALIPVGAMQWKLALVRSSLPQRIEVVFAGKARPLSMWQGTQGIDAPSLAGMTAERTLWEVRMPDQRRIAIEGAAPQTAAAHEMVRLQALHDLMTIPEDELTALATDDRRRWFARWNERRSDVRQRLSPAAIAGGSADPSGKEASLETLDRQWSELVHRFDAAAHDGAGIAAVDSAQRTRVETALPPAAEARCAMRGAVNTIVVVGGRNPIASLLARIGCAALIGAAGLAWSMGSRSGRRALGEWLERWSTLGIALVGVAWWLWLQPSIVGLVIVAGCAAASLRSIFRPMRDNARRIAR